MIAATIRVRQREYLHGVDYLLSKGKRSFSVGLFLEVQDSVR